MSPIEEGTWGRRVARHLHGRPWRPLGAAICGLATVMFILGVCLLDEKRGRTGFMLYWFVELGLTLWLCVLAFKDLRHTRRLTATAKRALLAELGTETAGVASEEPVAGAYGSLGEAPLPHGRGSVKTGPTENAANEKE